MIDYLKIKKIQYKEGRHTIYLLPQKELKLILKDFFSLYPENTGLKILKNPNRISDASYVTLKKKTLSQVLLTGVLPDLIQAPETIKNDLQN